MNTKIDYYHLSENWLDQFFKIYDTLIDSHKSKFKKNKNRVGSLKC